LLVEDHAVVRFGIAQLINRQADLVVCGEEEDASHALDAILRLRPEFWAGRGGIDGFFIARLRKPEDR
jgi:DNA-binding NarL/FixJ family response regulator